MLANGLHGTLQNAFAFAGLTKNIVQHRDRVHPGKSGLTVYYMPLLQNQRFTPVDGVPIGDEFPLPAIIGFKRTLANPLYQVVVAAAIFDQIADCTNFEVMLPRKSDQIV